MTDWRAYTLWQPWAGATACLGKDVENRTWPTSWRGPVMIHAGATWDPARRRDKCPLCCGWSWGPCPACPRDLDVLRSPHFGARCVVAVARVEDCDRVGHLAGPRSPWAVDGLYHHYLADRRALRTPVPWLAGQRGLWTPPRELVAAVEEEMR